MLSCSVVFAKLVIFHRYPGRVINLGVKMGMLYLYTSLLDPFVVFGGYAATKWCKGSADLSSKAKGEG